MLKNKIHHPRNLTSDCCRLGLEDTPSPMLQCCLVSGCKVEAQVAEPAESVANFACRGKGLGTPAQKTEVKFRGGLTGFMAPFGSPPHGMPQGRQSALQAARFPMSPLAGLCTWSLRLHIAG